RCDHRHAHARGGRRLARARRPGTTGRPPGPRHRGGRAHLDAFPLVRPPNPTAVQRSTSMSKRLPIVVVSLVAALTLAACGGNGDGNGGSGGSGGSDNGASGDGGAERPSVVNVINGSLGDQGSFDEASLCPAYPHTTCRRY